MKVHKIENRVGGGVAVGLCGLQTIERNTTYRWSETTCKRCQHVFVNVLYWEKKRHKEQELDRRGPRR